MLVWPKKDPDDIADYQLDWYTGKNDKPGQLQLDGDTIFSSTWIVPTDLTLEDESNDSTSATIWLSGGLNGKTYIITNRIVTAAGRQWDQSVKLPVKTK
jgi:hypothetical protein